MTYRWRWWREDGWCFCLEADDGYTRFFFICRVDGHKRDRTTGGEPQVKITVATAGAGLQVVCAHSEVQ